MYECIFTILRQRVLTIPANKNYFPVLRLRATPVGPRRKVMMTMATSTTADTPPWCHNIENCTATPSPSLGESIALKVGTRGNNSQKNHPPTVLREIPTRISTLPPTATVVDRHDDNLQRQQQAPRPSLPPPLTAQTSVSTSVSPPHDADNYVDRTLEKIAQLMRSWPSPQIDGAPRNITGPAPHHSNSLPSTANLPNHEPYDYKSNLDRIAAKVEQMSRRWPLTSAVTTNATTNPRPTMNEQPARCHASSLHPTVPKFP